MARVCFKNVVKQFGEVAAVDDLCLEAQDGELMVLVGPSGCGKTTSLRILAGLEGVTSGSVLIGEREVEKLPPRDRDIGMVFQDYALFPQMSVAENLSFGLRLRKRPKTEVRERVERAAEALELGELLERKPGELSGGQRQRVALGRALVRGPSVFLMDEPLSNLDAKLRTQTRGEIKRLQQEEQVTTIYVTHDQVEAMTLGDRIAVMRDGKLQQVGTPAEVYSKPASVFVASFIGSPGMSFGEFTVSSTPSGGAELSNGVTRIQLEQRPPELPDAAVVGIRPEHGCLWEQGRGLYGPLVGEVDFVEALGRETLVGVDLGNDFQPVVQISGTFDLEPGQKIEVGFERERLHFFEPETEHVICTL